VPLEGRALDAPVDLRTLLRAGLADDPDAVAIVAADERMRWRQLADAGTRLARSYLALGLSPGDRVASLMPNRIALVVHYLACFEAGLVTTPLNYRYTAPEIDHALAVSGAAALVAHAERAGDLAASRLAEGLRVGVVTVEGDAVTDGVRLESLLTDDRGPVVLPAVAPTRRPRSSSPRGAPGPRRASPTRTRPSAG
jgi:long-chain acyl-CoA synthetase